MRRVLVTGADGFVGQNLCQRLGERKDVLLAKMTRSTPVAEALALVGASDVVVHLAGANRPEDPADFSRVNAELTRWLIEAVGSAVRNDRSPPVIVFSSSIQASLDNPYGRSKRAAEEELLAAGERGTLVPRIFRLPNVFGKWSRPNYNSVVATFCHNIARGLPIRVTNPMAPLQLVYVDDVVGAFMEVIDRSMGETPWMEVSPRYETTVGAVADHIRGFAASRETLVIDRVGTGFLRALYATYVSYLPTDGFAYSVAVHADRRGEFVEMLKTPDCGQWSYFTAHPGVTRGGHYHHTKSEKFLVIRGSARFRFRHLQTGDEYVLNTIGGTPMIVESIPGWTHDVTNVGEGELLVMLWANEIFDRSRPDTVACPL
ncbi:MAG: NAD-dependent epimerase/dehydratase family protein [Bryobacterales bacterium]|nr:NAD-dependent epimerase/dehydratase family protein [Bryobacterales bacterium]